MVSSLNNNRKSKELEKNFGETARCHKKYLEYFYTVFRCGMSFKKIGTKTVYYTVGQKY